MRKMVIFVVLLICLSVLISCKKGKTTDSTTTLENTTNPVTTTEPLVTTTLKTGQVNYPLDAKLKEFVKSLKFYNYGGAEFEITEIGENRYKVYLSFDFEETKPVYYWNVEVKPNFTPTFHWAPHLTPTDNHIIAQHAFRSPSLIAQDDEKQVVLIPDLDLLGKSPVPWYMDMNALTNQLIIGVGGADINDHVLFVKKKDLTPIPAGKFEFGFYLFVDDKEEALENPWRNVLSFLWENYGQELYEAGEPTNQPLDAYVEHTYDWAFNRWKDAVYQEFYLNGTKVGAPTFIVNVTQSPNYNAPVNEREMRSVWNQAWFSSLRSASGLYRYAKATDNQDLLEKALNTKELALRTPQRNGIFPSVIATEMGWVNEGGQNYWRSLGWNTSYWGNSNRNPYTGDIRQSPYHVLDMSYTAYLMLNWYDELEKDERLKTYALTYADKLITLQDSKGFFPGWLDLINMLPKQHLNDSPETSMSVTFLLKAYELTNEQKYYDAAMKALDAVIAEIIPTGRWEDFETYWSCSWFGQDHVSRKFERNNMYKQNTLSMYWTAEALYYAYQHTKDEKYLKLGQRVLDEMLMAQSSWQPPYIYVNTLGGFGVMNADGEWNDARQSLFAELILKYGEELNMEEYKQRGLAALYASFIMMYCPENEKTKIQWEKAWPFFNEKDYGFMMENYGHGGETSSEGIGIGEFTIYDWGNGAASEAYLRIVDHFGKDYIKRN